MGNCNQAHDLQVFILYLFLDVDFADAFIHVDVGSFVAVEEVFVKNVIGGTFGKMAGKLAIYLADLLQIILAFLIDLVTFLFELGQLVLEFVVGLDKLKLFNVGIPFQARVFFLKPVQFEPLNEFFVQDDVHFVDQVQVTFE